MKTRKLFAAALALPMLFACTKENIKPSIEAETFDISVTVNSDDTKAVFDDTEGLLWVNPGSAGLVTSQSETEAAKESTKANPSEDGRKSTFTFTGITAGRTYRLFYPYCETYYPNIKFTVPAIQTQNAVGKSSDIFAGMATADITAGDGDNNLVDVKYQTVGSYIQFLVYGKAGEIVRYISVVSSDSQIAGEYLVNANDFTHSGFDGAIRSDRVLVALGDAGYTTTTAEGATGIYAAVLPGDSKNTYYVTTDNAIYAFPSSESKKFEAGSIKTVKLNLDNANVVEQTLPPTELYIVGNVTYVGWNPANAIKMTKEGNVFSTDVYLSTQWIIDNPEKPGEKKVIAAEGFKFLTQNQNFDTGYVKGTDGKLTYMSEGNGVADLKFTVPKAGYYHVEADFETGKVTCTPKAPAKLHVWGAATTAGWDSNKAIELTQSTENKFVFTAENVQLAANQEFKFFSEHSEYTAYVNDGSGKLIFFDSPSGSDADKKFTVNYTGKYNLTVNLKEGTVNCVLVSTPSIRVKSSDSWVEMTQKEPGVFIAKSWWIKSGDDEHDIQIRLDESQYINSGDYKQVNFESRTASLDGLSFDVVTSNNKDYSWWINNSWCKVRYDIIFDSNKNTVTIKYVPGKKFWLVGHQNVWTIQADGYSAEVDENGIAKWTLNATDNGIGGTDIKICGEYLYESDKWDSGGEWYYSNGTEGNVTVSSGKEYDVMPLNHDHKWYFQTGIYEVEFNTYTFKLKVTKK